MDEIKITSVLGNSQKLDGGAMFGNAPRPVWEKWIAPDSIGRIPLACRAMLVEVGNRKILCETGIGNFFSPKLKERFGVEGAEHLLLRNLKHLGYDESLITDIILSHLHFDHAGGLMNSYGDGAPRLLFPNAKIFVGEEAWERAQNPHLRDRASFIPEQIELLKTSPRLRVIPKNKTTTPELPSCFEFHYSHGHTPGHLHTIVKGKKNRILFCGDLIPGLPWVHLPITMGYDRYPEMLIDEKSQLLKQWSTSQDWLFYTHDTVSCVSKVEWDGKQFKPTDQKAELLRVVL